MSAATLCIQICSLPSHIDEEIEFFKAEEWTNETELTLLQRVHELLTLIRPMGKELHLSLNVRVSDSIAAIFTINKKLKGGAPEINTQKLTVREIEIIGLIMQGYTNQEIADKLFISYETVRTHRKNILLKTGAKNTATLIKYYNQTFFDK
jgi:DNA-binding CsgD family transcriptional regulator